MSTKTRQIIHSLENPTPEVAALETRFANALRAGNAGAWRETVRLVEDALGLDGWSPITLQTLNRLTLANKI